MAPDEHGRKGSVATIIEQPTEDTPLLERKESRVSILWSKSVVYRVLLTGFLVSLSFGVTQVPLIYVFGVMTCDEYYKNHPDAGLNLLQEPGLGHNRCQIHAIEASTARSVALLGTSTTLFGVINLFFTGWTMKAFGVKKALMLTVFFPAVRLAVQNIGVEAGADLGILIVQCSQMITVVGGPVGYLLALNSLATEVVEPAERTGTLGRLSGCAMFGTAIGYLAGGLIGDYLGIIWPFRVTLALFILCCIYIQLCLPEIHNKEVEAKASRSLSSFFDPIKMFAPQKFIRPNGHVYKEYGVLFLGIGTFLGVLATSYIPVLLQMYSTDVFGFGTSENGFLISINSLVRGFFLTFAFPHIISQGRKWLNKGPKHCEETPHPRPRSLYGEDTEQAHTPTRTPTQQPQDRTPVILTPNPLPAPSSPASSSTDPKTPLPAGTPPQEEEEEEKAEETSPFDLHFTQTSLLLDSLLTSLCTFTTSAPQMYLTAVILPLASGTGPAAKGTILQFCTPSQRVDALSAISLVELMARLSSTSLFGYVFAGFAERGAAHWTFAVNAGIAGLGWVVLIGARFPRDGGRRWVDGGEDEDGEERGYVEGRSEGRGEV
ncbi:hypothetical protein D0869_14136 [Hortaea werneckii]|uniref:Major facilitator superfamily (MFS) profile domain-containing protein n=1 Tax=Hortaea werneckii TaxID=91943 RepID=A0A3M6Y0F3_HORWE|nr:hypothetical protein KC334_g5479 [Hortaea werneckii]KAI7178243.1 hypothetical protein KC324_g9524 [Hortaea werneckii]KAI7580043.1 hypothetical protein KC316_g9169 [Hortaea werneckii]RMX72912.1 hypothetical protein D0869_14136 [Hortaea werneckii]RMX96431.1 hypothetical protein D0867_13147 [Hortaea werneckii]